MSGQEHHHDRGEHFRTCRLCQLLKAFVDDYDRRQNRATARRPAFKPRRNPAR